MHNDNKTIDEFISPDDPMYRYVTALYDFMKNEVDYSWQSEFCNLSLAQITSS